MKRDMLGVLKNLIFKKSSVTLVPSLPAQTWSELEGVMESLVGVSSDFQVDLVDGRFVPSISWPFNEKETALELAKLKKFSTQFDLEFDCMLLEPEVWLETFREIGIKRLVVHYGSTNALADIQAHAREHDYKVGLAFTNNDDLGQIENLISGFDFIQVMGISEVGKQGQPFDNRTLATISLFREKFADLEIAVDGAVNQDTIPILLRAGADRLAPGSAIAKSSDPKKAFGDLKKIID